MLFSDNLRGSKLLAHSITVIMKVTDKEQTKKLDELRRIWRELHDKHTIRGEGQDVLDRVHAEIERRFHQFDSCRIIVICAGMLKAGKSTLVNLLAGTENASPIGYGIDTTLRPVLIRAAEANKPDGLIEVYNGRDMGGADEEEIRKSRELEMKLVLDKLRGLPVKGVAEPRVYELTQSNLRNLLCEPAGKGYDSLSIEPLLVVVHTPPSAKSRLFSISEEGFGCMLLDMPGLDSDNANVSTLTEDYLAVINESDLLIFIQSSVAPLNAKAGECLKKIRTMRDATGYRLIQNRMETKPWLNKEQRNKEQAHQCEHAKNLFKKYIANTQNIPITEVNLGMAWQGKFGMANHLTNDVFWLEDVENNAPSPIDDETRQQYEALQGKLWDKSGFSQMEEDLVHALNSNGRVNRLNHCLKTLQTEIETRRAELEKDLLRHSQEALSKVTQEVNNWKETRKDLQDLINQARIHDHIKFTLPEHTKKTIEQSINDAFTEAERKLPRTRVTEPYKMKGSEINDFVKDCAANAHKNVNKVLTNTLLSDVVDGNNNPATAHPEKEVNKIVETLNHYAKENRANAHCYTHLAKTPLFNPGFANCKYNAHGVSIPPYKGKIDFVEMNMWTLGLLEKKFKFERSSPIWADQQDAIKEHFITESSKLIANKTGQILSHILKETNDGMYKEYFAEIDKQEKLAQQLKEELTNNVEVIKTYLEKMELLQKKSSTIQHI